jgi:hypothetical protein
MPRPIQAFICACLAAIVPAIIMPFTPWAEFRTHIGLTAFVLVFLGMIAQKQLWLTVGVLLLGALLVLAGINSGLFPFLNRLI